MKRIEAKLGGTRYVIEPQEHSNALKITRYNETEKVMYVPAELIFAFVAEHIAELEFRDSVHKVANSWRVK